MLISTLESIRCACDNAVVPENTNQHFSGHREQQLSAYCPPSSKLYCSSEPAFLWWLYHCCWITFEQPDADSLCSSLCGYFAAVAEASCSSKVRNLSFNLLTQNNPNLVINWLSSTCWGDGTTCCVVRRVAAKLLFVVLSVVERRHRTCLVLSIWPSELRIIQQLPGYRSHQTPSRQQEARAKAGKTK